MDDRAAAAAELTKALGHRLRLEFLRELRERGELSPSEFARDSDDPLGNVSYHVKALFEAGVVEVSARVPRRGAMEHRYSLTGKRAAAAMAVLELLASS